MLFFIGILFPHQQKLHYPKKSKAETTEVEGAGTGSFKDATATIIFFGKLQNQNCNILKM
jgi:hypothetical protein